MAQIRITYTGKNGKPKKQIRAKGGKDAALLVKVELERQRNS